MVRCLFLLSLFALGLSTQTLAHTGVPSEPSGLHPIFHGNELVGGYPRKGTSISRRTQPRQRGVALPRPPECMSLPMALPQDAALRSRRQASGNSVMEAAPTPRPRLSSGQ